MDSFSVGQGSSICSNLGNSSDFLFGGFFRFSSNNFWPEHPFWLNNNFLFRSVRRGFILILGKFCVSCGSLIFSEDSASLALSSVEYTQTFRSPVSIIKLSSSLSSSLISPLSLYTTSSSSFKRV